MLPRLPQGVQTELGPDATGVGWVFQYALVDTTGRHDLAELRSLPGLVPALPPASRCRASRRWRRSAASSGSTRCNVDPNRLRAYNIPIDKVVEAVRAGNNDVGGRLVEFAGAEYMVRGRGYATIAARYRQHRPRARSESGVPVRVRDVGEVTLGPDMRRGVADLDGTGDVVAGIVVMRQGENALRVIERVKAKLEELEPSLPAGREGRHRPTTAPS